MSLNPTASFAGFTTASATEFVQSTTALDIQFTNPTPGATEAGYQPYVTVELPSGVTWGGTATYMGNAVRVTTVMLSGVGTAPYPFALSGGGTRPLITGAPNATVVVAELPFGSFTPGQTALDLSIPVTLASTAAPGIALAIKTTAGFAYGNSPLGANGVVQATPSTFTITPTVATVTTVYNGPQGQAATGPTIQATYGGAVPSSSESITVHSDIASGVTIHDFALSDALPNGAVPTEVLLTSNSGAKWYYVVSPATGAMTLDTTLTSAGDQATSPAITTAAAAAGATAPYVYYDAASGKVTADFGNVVGTSTANGQNIGPSITTWFYEGPQQSLGHGSATAQTTGPLQVVDNLPYQAVARSFSISGPNGEFWKYSVNGAGVVSFVSGPGGAPAILGAAGASNATWVYFDKTGGKIVANFANVSAGQSATIDAAYSGGQAQPQPGVVSTTIGAGNNASVGLVDQLAAGSQAGGFTVTIGGTSYSFTIGSGGVISGVIGNGAGAPAASSFSYDSANSRITANLTNVPGGAGGALVTLSASNVSGGTVVSAGGQAVAELSSASATGTFTLPTGAGSLAGLSASTSLSVQDLTVQKSVTPENANVIPGSDLDYSITGQIGSLVDLHNVVVSDTLGDGQFFDTSVAPSLTINVGGATHVIGFGAGDVLIGAQDPITGRTLVTFNVSQAMTDAGLGFSDFSVQGNNPATFAINFKTTVDTQYRANPTPANDPANYAADRATYAPWITNPLLSPRILSGDVINNTLTTTGTLANGAVVSTGANASAKVPNSTLFKSILLVDGAAPVLNAAGQINANTGSVITYELKEVLPVTNASNVTLTDFLPLPVFTAAGFTFDSTYHATLGAQTGGVITWAPGDTFHTVNGTGPAISYNAAQNAVVMNFDGQENLASYATTTIDLLFNAVVQDSAFAQDLQLTNQVVSNETNSFNEVSSNQAIGRITLNAPELKIEKGAVATNSVRGLSSGTKGGVVWNSPGSATPFTGTINSQALGGGGINGTSVLNSSISQLGAGDKVTFAVAVENLGADPMGAFNITLHDVLPSTLTLANVSNFRVVDGTGATLTYNGTAANFFSGTGITLKDPSTTQGALAAVSLTSGKNVAVVLYDVTLPDNVATPDETITNTATIDSYTAASGSVNRATIAPAGYNTAAATITTDHPRITKSFVSTGGGEGQNAVRIGDTVTYEYVVTLPGGSATGMKLSDVLPSGISLAGTSFTAGGDVTFTGPGLIIGTTTIDLGTVTVGSNAQGSIDQVTVDVVGRVTASTPGNIGGAQLVNTARITENNPNGGAAVTQTSNPVSITLAEPVLALTKSVVDLTRPGAAPEGGDQLKYTITVSNTGNGTSFANSITDAITSQIGSFATLDIGSVVASGTGPGTLAVTSGNTSGNTSITVTDTEIDAGKSATVSFTVHLKPDATLGSVVANSASVLGSTLPALAGGAVDANARAVSASGNAQVTLAIPSTVKTLLTTSDVNTPGAFLAAGETATFDIKVTVPEGTAKGLTITDLLPAGMSYVSASVTGGANLSGIATSVSTSGNTISIAAGDVVDTRAAGAADTAADVLDIHVIGRVLPGNATGATLNNKAFASITTAGGVVNTNTSATAISVVAPVLDLTKTTPFISGDAGSIVTYTSVISVDTTSTGPAYNVTLSDPMAPSLLLVHGSETLMQGGVAVGSVSETANGFIATIGTLLQSDAPITVTYQAKLANTVADGSVLPNTATLDYASQASFGQSYETTAQAVVHAHLVDQFSKSLIGSSLGTPQGGPPPEVVQGETLTYTLTGTLDTGTQHLVLNDVLPAGLDYLSSKVVSLGNTSGSALAVGASGTFNNVTDTVSFDFGAAGITNPAGSSDSKVVVQVVVKVDGASGFLNTLQSDTGHLITSTPTGAPGIGAGANLVTLADTQTVKIVPPGAIGGIAFLDGNCTGIYHVGEAGVAGVTVKLFDALGNFTGQTAITDNTGAYSFTPLAPGKYEVQFVAPQGTSFPYTEHASGNSLLDSDVNPTTGLSDVLTVVGGQNTAANAGLGFNDNFNGVTPIDLGNNGVDAYGQNGVYKGNGGATYHVGGNAPGQTILTLHGVGMASTVEAGGGNGNDIVTSCGPINGQGQNAANIYMQAGPGGSSNLQGGSGNSTLIGSTGNDLIAAGSGVNVLTGGGNSGTVFASGGNAYGFSTGDELRTGGISTTILFQKGDGVDNVDNGFRLGTDKLTIYGYSSAKVTYINSQAALYFGGNDLIYFNGASPFTPGTITNGSIAGVTFVPSLPGTPTSVLIFPSSGQPTIGPSSATPASGPAPVSPAPVPPSVPSGGGTVNLTWGQTYNFGGTGTYVVGFGDNHVTGGHGDNAMTVMGWNNVITFGDGNNKVFGPGDASKQGNTTVTVGNGNNLIGLSGYHNMVTTGNGTNTVVLGDGDSTIDTQGGTDAVVLAGWNNLVIGGLGHDTVAGGQDTTYRINGLGGGMDIYNFAATPTIGSTLDIHNVLASVGYGGNPATLGSFVTVTSTATDTLIKVAGSQVADLHNVTGVTLSSLLANHNLVT